MIVIFDLDHTLFRANSSYCFGAFLFRHGFISLPGMMRLLYAYARHKLGSISLEQLHEFCFKALFKGRSAPQMQLLVDIFLSNQMEKLLNPSVYERLMTYPAEAVHLYSSSPDFIVESVAAKLGVQHVYCTVYGADSKGRFDQIRHLVTGVEKAQKLESIKQGRKATVFSDCSLDLPLLQNADIAVCVNPDKKLRRIALTSNWEIIDN